MRSALFGMAAVLTGCAAVQAPVAPAWDGTEECFVRLMEPVRVRMSYKEFNDNYRNVLLGAVSVSLTSETRGSVQGTLAFLKGRGWYCGHSVRSGGVTGPPESGGDLDAVKVVLFDELGVPRFQVAQLPWSRFAVLDADGDPATLELVRWSEKCDGSDLPFLSIHRLSDLSAPSMLTLVLNPPVARESRSVFEGRMGEDGVYRSTSRPKLKPDRTGRWRFETTGGKQNDIVIEEFIMGEFKVVARFVLNDKRSAWIGPAGGVDHFWKTENDP